MKVSELIAELQKLPADAKVLIDDGDGYAGMVAIGLLKTVDDYTPPIVVIYPKT